MRVTLVPRQSLWVTLVPEPFTVWVTLVPRQSLWGSLVPGGFLSRVVLVSVGSVVSLFTLRVVG